MHTRPGGPCCAWSGTGSGPRQSWPTPPGCPGRWPASTSSAARRRAGDGAGGRQPPPVPGRPGPVAEVAAFLDEFWAGRLQRLRAAAESDARRGLCWYGDEQRDTDHRGSSPSEHGPARSAACEAVVKLLVQEVTIAAPAERVYRLLTDPAEFVRWMAEEAASTRARRCAALDARQRRHCPARLWNWCRDGGSCSPTAGSARSRDPARLDHPSRSTCAQP